VGKQTFLQNAAELYRKKAKNAALEWIGIYKIFTMKRFCKLSFWIKSQAQCFTVKCAFPRNKRNIVIIAFINALPDHHL